MNRKTRHSRRLKMPEITLTPLIDTALTLLVIFIITAPMAQNTIKIDLPAGKTQDITQAQDFAVTITKQGNLYFNNYPITSEQLSTTIHTIITQNPEAIVFVKGDETTPYGKIIELVDTLKRSGVKYVAMATRTR